MCTQEYQFLISTQKLKTTIGECVDLQELGTEGQGTTLFPDRDKYSLIQYAIAMGGGFKIAVNPSFNIILEYGAEKHLLTT